MDSLINILRNFNFTESESKVYISLLQNGPCSGYEISKLSGVARSKVYNVLESMIARGIVVCNTGEKSSLYKAESVEHVSSLIKNSTENNLAKLIEEAARFSNPVDNEEIWKLSNYDSIISKCQKLIDKSKTEVLVQIWVDDLDYRLENSLLRKQDEIGRVLIVLYDSKERYNTRLKKFYRHGFEYDKLLDAGSRWITISVDSTEMVHASIRNTSVAEAIYTKNRSMVFFANEYIKHDAYCLRLIESMGDRVKTAFGDDMEGIRDVFAIK